MFTFNGGIHPDYRKITAGKSIENAELPDKIILPMSQHIGCACDPLVKIGDLVKTGQKVADSSAPMSAPIHSSVSGTVTSIEDLPHPVTGKLTKCIIIESDGKDEKVEMLKRDYESFSPDDLRKIIREAGIVGLGGAAFPTHIKLTPPKDKIIDTLIINGAECEPYLTTDHRLMLESSKELVEGIRLIKKILGAKNVYIGVEDNKKDAIRLLKDKCHIQNIKVVELKTKYPQGAEKTLIYAITKRKVPAGGLPSDVGCVVQNIGTAVAIYEAIALSKPLYERVITVTGRVVSPKNLLVRNGMLTSDLVNQAGGYKGLPKKIINGGPMMGFSMPTDELPVIKGTSGIVVFNEDDLNSQKTIPCIKCGKCVEICPMNLIPCHISRYAEKGMIEHSEKFYAMDCFECGCCAFVCPSHIPLVHWIRFAKSEIQKKKAAEKEMKK